MIFERLILSVWLMAVGSFSWADEPEVPEPTPFALVEMFSMESCFRCIRAEKTWNRVAKTQKRKKKTRVYLLAFHVDYDKWKDPFVLPNNNNRHEMYAQKLDKKRLYFPQMIINGVESLENAKCSRVSRNISAALERKAAVGIGLRATLGQDGKGTVRYRLKHAVPGQLLNVALVEWGIVSRVTVGKTRGRTLRHENIVRRFQVIKLKALKGTVSLAWNKKISLERAAVIVYVQASATLKVLGVEQVAVQ